MKRLITVFLLLLVLASCGNGNAVRDRFSLPMTLCARTDGSDELYYLSIDRQICDVTFDRSSVLNGVNLHFEGGKCVYTCGEYTLTVDEGAFPAVSSLIRAIRTIADTEENGTEVENGIKYTIDETVILVYYNEDTDIVTGIKTEELGRVFEFTLSDLKPYEAQSNGAGQP